VGRAGVVAGVIDDAADNAGERAVGDLAGAGGVVSTDVASEASTVPRCCCSSWSSWALTVVSCLRTAMALGRRPVLRSRMALLRSWLACSWSWATSECGVGVVDLPAAGGGGGGGATGECRRPPGLRLTPVPVEAMIQPALRRGRSRGRGGGGNGRSSQRWGGTRARRFGGAGFLLVSCAIPPKLTHLTEKVFVAQISIGQLKVSRVVAVNSLGETSAIERGLNR